MFHELYTLCPKWSGTVKLISIVLLYVTTINYVFNHSRPNLHLFCMHVENFIKIHHTVSEINVFKTWHIKCERSNIARANSLLPINHVPFLNTLRYNRIMLRLIELMRRRSFSLAILPITSHRGGGHQIHRTWIRSTTLWGVLQERVYVGPYPDSRRWPSEAATYRRVESLRPENHWPSSASVACSSKRRPLSTNCNQHCAAWLSHVGKLSFFGVSIFDVHLFVFSLFFFRATVIMVNKDVYIICCNSETKQWMLMKYTTFIYSMH